MSSKHKIPKQLSLSQPVSIKNTQEKVHKLHKDVGCSSQPLLSISSKDGKVLKESPGNEIAKNDKFDDLDDSFDVFVSPKFPKTMASTSSSSSASSRTGAKKRKSPYFDKTETPLDLDAAEKRDLKLALELSMQENYKGTSIPSCNTKKETRTKRICIAPLLLRRTPVEREKIITEKVAMVLMDDKENKTVQRPTSSKGVLSTSLKKELDESARLWKMSQMQLNDVDIGQFFIESFSNYENTALKFTAKSPPSNQNDLQNIEENNGSDGSFAQNVNRIMETEENEICVNDQTAEEHEAPAFENSKEANSSFLSDQDVFLESYSESVSREVESNNPFSIVKNEPDVEITSQDSNSSNSRFIPVETHSTPQICFKSEYSNNQNCDETVNRFENHSVMMENSENIHTQFEDKLDIPQSSTSFHKICDSVHLSSPDVSICDNTQDGTFEGHCSKELTHEKTDTSAINNNELDELYEESKFIVVGSPSSVSSIYSVKTEEHTSLLHDENTMDNFDKDDETSSSSPRSPLFAPELCDLELKALQSLSEDSEKIWMYPESYPISIVCSDESFSIQSNILFSRCPLIYKEVRKHKLLWNHYSQKECKAFFKYIVTGKIDHLKSLDSSTLFTIRGICTRYDLKILNEVISYHLRNIYQSDTKSPKKTTQDNIEGDEDEIHELSIVQKSRKFYIKTPNNNVPCYVVDSDDDDDKANVHDSNWKKRMGKKYNTETQPELITIDSEDSNNVEVIQTPEQPNNEELGDLLETFINYELELNPYRIPVPCSKKHEIIDLVHNRVEAKRKRFTGSSPKNIQNSSPINLDNTRTPESSRPVTPKNPDISVDRYFQDSFPQLTSFNTPEHEAPNQGAGNFKWTCATPGGQLISVSDKATPQVDYQSIGSPELERELRKYGIKPDLGRRKGVMLLNYIYEQLHPDKNDPALRSALPTVYDLSQPSCSYDQPSTSKAGLAEPQPGPSWSNWQNQPSTSKNVIDCSSDSDDSSYRRNNYNHQQHRHQDPYCLSSGESSDEVSSVPESDCQGGGGCSADIRRMFKEHPPPP